MKLLMCKKCKCLIVLTLEKKCCACSKSGGAYVNELVVVVHGPAIVIAMNNSDLHDALDAGANSHVAIRAWKMGRRGDSVRWVRSAQLISGDDYLKQTRLELEKMVKEELE